MPNSSFVWLAAINSRKLFWMLHSDAGTYTAPLYSIVTAFVLCTFEFVAGFLFASHTHSLTVCTVGMYFNLIASFGHLDGTQQANRPSVCVCVCVLRLQQCMNVCYMLWWCFGRKVGAAFRPKVSSTYSHILFVWYTYNRHINKF